MGIPTSNISVSIQKLVPDVVAEIESSMKLSSFVEQYGLYLYIGSTCNNDYYFSSEEKKVVSQRQWRWQKQH